MVTAEWARSPKKGQAWLITSARCVCSRIGMASSDGGFNAFSDECKGLGQVKCPVLMFTIFLDDITAGTQIDREIMCPYSLPPSKCS